MICGEIQEPVEPVSTQHSAHHSEVVTSIKSCTFVKGGGTSAATLSFLSTIPRLSWLDPILSQKIPSGRGLGFYCIILFLGSKRLRATVPSCSTSSYLDSAILCTKYIYGTCSIYSEPCSLAGAKEDRGTSYICPVIQQSLAARLVPLGKFENGRGQRPTSHYE